MMGLESLGTNGKAIADVGIVLLEAMILYVGYGAVTSVLGGRLKRALGGD